MTLRVHGGPSIELRAAETGATSSPAAPAVEAALRSDRGERFRGALGALARQIDDGEKLVKRALSPGAGRLGAGDLIALQAGIYRYSEAVDLAAKLVDRAGSAIRTTLQGSGQ
jgi:hypothetical protein